MSWKNIKSFMIILLLLACIVVGAMLWLNGDNEPYTDDALEKAAELMSESGISVSVDQLQGDFSGMKLYRFTLPQDYPERVAEKLASGKATDVFAVPNGIAIRTDQGESLFVGNDFTISYRCLNARDGATEQEIATLLVPDCQFPEFGVLKKKGTESDGEVIFVQTLGDYPFPESEVKCNFVDGKLSSFSGKWYFPDKCSTFSAQLRDYLNIMFTERERVDTENADAENKKTLTVKELEKCYGVESGEGKSTFVLVPSLHIVYKEGEEAIHGAVPD